MASEETTPQPVHPTTLDVIERLAKIISLLAIPIVIPIALAIYSAKVQEGARRENISRDYVQLAVSILKEKKEDVNPSLRDWAVDLLAEHSPTKFNPEVITALRSGSISLPGILSAMSGKVGTISPDGKFVATADRENVRFTDVSNGKEWFIRASDRVTGLSFSRDGSLLAVGDESGGVMILQMASAQVGVRFKIDQPISALTFSELGQIQIVSSLGSVYIYSQDGVLIRKMRTPRSPANLKVTAQ